MNSPQTGDKYNKLPQGTYKAPDKGDETEYLCGLAIGHCPECPFKISFGPPDDEETYMDDGPCKKHVKDNEERGENDDPQENQIYIKLARQDLAKGGGPA